MRVQSPNQLTEAGCIRVDRLTRDTPDMLLANADDWQSAKRLIWCAKVGW